MEDATLLPPISYHRALHRPQKAYSNMDVTLNSVQVGALVVMKIQKHCASSFPTIATGSLLGMENNSTLEVTNCFPFPTSDVSASDPHPNDHMAASNIAAAAPRAKGNIAYQNEMIKNLNEVNVDANNVGYYTSANMGNFINTSLVENLYHYQKDVNEHAVVLVHDLSRSIQGTMSLKAYRLSATFMAAYKEQKFNTENMQKIKLTYKDILIEVPITIHTSHLQTQFFHQLPTKNLDRKLDLSTATVADLERQVDELPLYPNFDALDLSIDPFLEKTCDQLYDSVEAHYTELNNHQYYQRQMAREQVKITAWQAKRKAENAARAAAKQTPLPEDEWKQIFKLPVEPSRLEGMLIARQVEQYSRQIDGFTATVSAKMFAVKNNMLPGDLED